MKKTRLIILVISILYYNLSLSQKEVSDTLFWYKVDFDTMRDSINFKPYFKIVKVYPEVISGTAKIFVNFQKENMQNGKLAIGPFMDKESVMLSLHYYTNLNVDSVIQNENLSSDYYCYYLKVNEFVKNNGLDFTRISSTVNSLSIQEFKEVIHEGLEYPNLIFGPFPKQTDAEYSRSVNSLLVPKQNQQDVIMYNPRDYVKYIDYETFYWFSLKLETEKDSISKLPIYHIKEVNPEIIWGSSKKYIESQKEHMKNGLVCVGPFDDMQNAQIAKSAYTKLNDLTDIDTSGYSEYFYYDYQIKTVRKNGSKEFSRAPARVEEGSLLDFKKSLFQGINTHHFIIGPFVTQSNAEDSKFYNRKLEPKHPKMRKYKD